jgi:hypothetical protein
VFSVIFYTNNSVSEKVLALALSTVKGTIATSAEAELIVVSWQPLPIQNNIVWKIHESSHKNIYNQIMAGLKKAKHDTIFLAEHDVLYPKSHFDLRPQDKIVYNSNVYHLTRDGYFKAPPVNFLSALVAKKEILTFGIQEKLKEIETTGRVVWAEPQGPNGCERVEGADPIIDIRHGHNLTGMRSSEKYLEELKPWGRYEQYTTW